MIYLAHLDQNQAIQNLEIVRKLVHFFEWIRLTINADKTEFILFCKPFKDNQMKNRELVRKEIIKFSDYGKFLGVFLDLNLIFQNE